METSTRNNNNVQFCNLYKKVRSKDWKDYISYQPSYPVWFWEKATEEINWVDKEVFVNKFWLQVQATKEWSAKVIVTSTNDKSKKETIELTKVDQKWSSWIKPVDIEWYKYWFNMKKKELTEKDIEKLQGKEAPKFLLTITEAEWSNSTPVISWSEFDLESTDDDFPF